MSVHAGTTILPAIVLLWATPAPSLTVRRIESEPLPTSRNPLAQSPIPIQVVPFNLQNAPQRFQANPQFTRYRLGLGDTISIIVPRFPDLSVTATVNPEGNVVVPLLGSVPVAGLTLEEAQEKIRIGLNRFVIEPTVTVGLLNQRPVQVTVTGEIFRPGFYILGPQSTISNILAVAGGTTNLADVRSILVRRFLIDGSFIEQRLNLLIPLISGDPLPDLRLQDGDVVVVPKLEVGTAVAYDNQLVSRSTVAQPVINIRVLSYPGNRLGTLPIANGSSFLDAIVAISPTLQTTDITRVALIRFDPERGRPIIRELNAKKALFGDASENVPLRNNDVIVLGRNLVARITYAFSTFTQPFRDILGFLLFFQSLSESATDLFNPTGNDDNND